VLKGIKIQGCPIVGQNWHAGTKLGNHTTESGVLKQAGRCTAPVVVSSVLFRPLGHGLAHGITRRR
jgi:hypothetical protein